MQAIACNDAQPGAGRFCFLAVLKRVQGQRQIRPIALGRNNWLFAGSLRAGQRAAAIMSLIGSAKMNGLDPYAYLRDVLERLPTHPARRIDELLPHRWHSTSTH